MKLIGMLGYKGHGKDTMAQAIADVAWSKDHSVRLMSFGEALKSEAAFAVLQMSAPTSDAICGHGALRTAYDADTADETWKLLRGAFDDVTQKEEFRLFMQWYGTEFRRRYWGDDYWVRRVEDKLAFYADDPKALVIVTDVRFPNEVEMIEKHGGLTMKVIRPDKDTNDPHPSERALDKYVADVTYINQPGDNWQSRMRDDAWQFWHDAHDSGRLV